MFFLNEGINPTSEKFVFYIGFKKISKITIFGKNYEIIEKLNAYRKEDGITEDQLNAYISYCNNKKIILKKAENSLINYSSDAKKRFTPKTVLFARNGEIALLCDDRDYPDEGIAFVLSSGEIMSQDEYL